MRSVEEIYRSLCGRFSERSGLALVDGGDMSLRLYAVAAEIAALDANIDFVARQAFPQTATGGYLDYHAEMRGLKRGAATFAEGALRFYTNEAARSELAIPKGTVCMNAAMVEFETTRAGAIAAGETMCDIPARARKAGAEGNAPAGSVCIMELAPTGVAGVVNTAAFLGGGGAESDAELSARVVGSYKRLPNGANKAYYETKALNVDGVCAVSVLPKSRGVGTVDVVISADGGLPGESLVREVQELLDAEREICVDILAAAPEAVTVDISAQLVIADGADADTVLKNAQAALRGYFTGGILGKSIYRARLGAILLGVEGVENYAIASPAQDIAVGAAQLGVLGTLALSQAV